MKVENKWKVFSIGLLILVVLYALVGVANEMLDGIKLQSYLCISPVVQLVYDGIYYHPCTFLIKQSDNSTIVLGVMNITK